MPPCVHTVHDGRYRLSLFHGMEWGELSDLADDPCAFVSLLGARTIRSKKHARSRRWCARRSQRRIRLLCRLAAPEDENGGTLCRKLLHQKLGVAFIEGFGARVLPAVFSIGTMRTTSFQHRMETESAIAGRRARRQPEFSSRSGFRFEWVQNR